MCSLCGDLGARAHWTDSGAAGPDGPGAAERAVRVRLAAALLRTEGLELRAWQGRYLVATGRGRTEVVRDLGAVWAAAQRLTGRAADPLAPAAVAAIAQAARR
jgi:hypothetical protein